jgi:hypothetical protein
MRRPYGPKCIKEHLDEKASEELAIQIFRIYLDG